MTQPSTARPEISKAQLLQELSAFANPSDKKGVTLVLRDHVLYWAFIATVLLAEPMWLKVVAALMAGFRLSSFYTLAHDAAHGTLARSKRLNWVLALLAGVPATHNYRMWSHDHNKVHHPYTNGDHFDYYTPYSKAGYDALPWHKKVLEHIYRAPLGIGLWLYFAIHWFPTRVYPNVRTPKDQVPESRKYSALLLAYHGSYVAFLLCAPAFAPITALQAVLLGWVLPLFTLMFLSSTSLYIMHTHPDIPWFKSDDLRSNRHSPEVCSVVWVLPDWFSKVVNNVYNHAAHHAHAGIPSYHLLAAQKRMNELVGHKLVIEKASVRTLLRTMRTCKLYDYENHQWLDFKGQPSAPRIDLERKGLVALRNPVRRPAAPVQAPVPNPSPAPSGSGNALPHPMADATA
ncbi:omega-6 fatty acid desaturase (delta-12 desaturase) [Acidovorax soli]|uniref:Omega-6 fatty acid desaturase (Delta-12 desaturase) n=1 Tax=Acidovorax soli TaxID=592050 RepID=A0A7X0UAX9_9BURK|nr:fatty acid desaturase [Acidovorax soli]MBB6561736.1 omega-6 fatty acid desaturase (delta-12 desaturase) [Acidovorax soli]